MAKKQKSKDIKPAKENTKRSFGDTLKTIWYGKGNGNSKAKKGKDAAITVQDLLTYDEINERGIISANGAYFVMLEVSQLNANLLDFAESSTVWLNFGTMLNSINMRHTYLLQNQFYDVNEFVNEFERLSTSLTNLTPELEEAREDAINYYRNFSEERNLEQRGYLIFRFNPKREGKELGLSTGNARIDELFTQIKNTNSAEDEEENRNLAVSMLEEVSDLAYQLLYSIGCPSIRLNKEGVMEYMYGLLNRDIAIQQRLQDAHKFNMFDPHKRSDTPEIIVDTIDQLSKSDELYVQYYEQNGFEYEDDEMIRDLQLDAVYMPTQIVEEQELVQPVATFSTTAIDVEIDVENTKPVIEQHTSTFQTISESEVTESGTDIQLTSTTNDTDNNNNVVELTAQERKRLRRAKARKNKKERTKNQNPLSQNNNEEQMQVSN